MIPRGGLMPRVAVDVRCRQRQLHQLADQLDLLAQAADVLEGDIERAFRNMAVVIVEDHLGGLVHDAHGVRHLVDLVGRSGMRVGERHVEHRTDAGGRPRRHQLALDVRHQVVRHGDVDRRIELDALDRADLRGLDLDRFIEMRLDGLAHKTIEPDDAGAAVGVLRRVEPHQDAAAALGGDPHDRVGGDAELRHQGAVEADHEPRAVAELVGQVVHAGMNVSTSAVGVGAVIGMRAVVHDAS